METKSIITALLVLQIGWAMAQTKTKATETKSHKEQNESTSLRDPSSGIYVYAENPPVFPGGVDSLRDFVARNVVYPKQAMKENIHGRVYVRFCITNKGKVELITIIRGVHPLLDSAAIAVVRKMPKWYPGKTESKPVNVWYVVPVNFKLPENSKK